MTSNSRSTSSELRKLASALVVNGKNPFEAGLISIGNTGTLFKAAEEIDRLRKALEIYAEVSVWRTSTNNNRMIFDPGNTDVGWEIAAKALGESNSTLQ